MKQFILLILSLIFFANYSNANTIAAIVEDKTITLSQVQQYKKLMSYFNNVKITSSEEDRQYTKMVLGSMIDDEVLSQYAAKTGISASHEEIGDFLSNVEKNFKLKPGQLMQNVTQNLHLPASVLKDKLRAEVLRSKIMREVLSHNITVTKNDVESLVLSTNLRDANVHLKIFTGKNDKDKTYKYLSNLCYRVKDCKTLGRLGYKSFATVSDLNTKLSELAPNMQTLVKDMHVGQASEVIKDDHLKVVVLCEKTIAEFSEQDSNSVAQFLGNKRLTLKAKKFFQNLRKKAYIKVLM